MSTIAYKGFDPGWSGRGYQYKIGRVEASSEDPVMCRSGFHACLYPLHTWHYYPPAWSVYAKTELLGYWLEEHHKVVTDQIKPVEPLSVRELILAAHARHPHGYDGHKTSVYGNAVTTTTEDRKHAATAGLMSVAVATGGLSWSVSTGFGSVSIARGAAGSLTTGGGSIAVGHRVEQAVVAKGDTSTAVNVGNSPMAHAQSLRSQALAVGPSSGAFAPGEAGVSVSLSERRTSPRAEAGPDGAIVLIRRDHDGTVRHVFASKVGENGIKPGVAYTLNEDGELEALG